MTTEKKVRTSRQPESIFKGALSLSLEDKVMLLKELKGAIEKEVSGLKAAADNAAKIVNGV